MGSLKPKLSITNELADLRAQKGLTQQQLADKIEVTRATIIALEKGNYNPSLELSFRLAQFFKKDIQQIFKVEKKK